MLAVAEGDVVDGGVDELVLQALAVALAHLREAEGVVYVCVGVDRLVVVGGMCSRNEECALRDERAVDESDVFHCIAGDGR